MSGAAPAIAPRAAVLDLVLEPESHTYTYKGRPVVGVTRALQDAKVLDYSGIPQDVLDVAAARGKDAHLALEYLDKGTLNFETLRPELQPYIKAYQRFCLDTSFEPGMVECRRYNQALNYAGMLDRTGLIGNTELVLDFKTGIWQEGHCCQLVAYSEFFPHPRRFRLIGLQLKKDGSYKAHEVPLAKRDMYLSVFRSALCCAQFNLSTKGRKSCQRLVGAA